MATNSAKQLDTICEREEEEENLSGGDSIQDLHVTEDPMNISSGTDEEGDSSHEGSHEEAPASGERFRELTQDSVQQEDHHPSMERFQNNRYNQRDFVNARFSPHKDQWHPKYYPEKYAVHNTDLESYTINTVNSEMYGEPHYQDDGRESPKVWEDESEGSKEDLQDYAIEGNSGDLAHDSNSQDVRCYQVDGHDQRFISGNDRSSFSASQGQEVFNNDQSEYLATEDSINQLQRKYEVRGNEIDHLIQKLDEANDNINSLKSEKGTLYAEKKILEVKCQELENLRQEYEARLRKLKTDLKEQTKKAEDYEEMNRKLEFESNSNKGTIKNLEMQVANLMSDDILKKSNQAHEDFIRKLRSTHSEETGDMKMKINSLTSKVEGFENENMRLRKELDDLRYHRDQLWQGKTTLHNNQLEEVHHLNDDLKQRLEATQKELNNCRNELEMSKKKTLWQGTAKQDEQIGDLHRLNDEQCQRLKVVQNELTSCKAELEASRQRVAEEIESRSQEREEYARNLEASYEKTNQIQDKLTQLRQELGECKEQNLSQLQLIHQLEAKLKESQHNYSTLEVAKHASDTANTELQLFQQELLEKLNAIQEENRQTKEQLESQEMLFKLGIANKVFPPEDSIAHLDIAKTLNFEDSNNRPHSNLGNPQAEVITPAAENSLDYVAEFFKCSALNEKYCSQIADLEKRLHDSQTTVHQLTSHIAALKEKLSQSESLSDKKFKGIMEVVVQDLHNTRDRLSFTEEEVTKFRDLYNEKCDLYIKLHQRHNKLKLNVKDQIDHYKGEAIRLSNKIKNLRLDIGTKFKDWLCPFRVEALACIAEIIEKLNSIDSVNRSLIKPHLVALSMTYQILEKLDVNIDRLSCDVEHS